MRAGAGIVRRRHAAGAPPASPRAPQAGFTIVELAVATVVLLVAVLIVCDLLDESGRLLHHSVQRERDPWTLLAAELLRNDLRAGAASPPLAGPDAWSTSDEHLSLSLSSGGTVTWGAVGDELVRAPAGGNAHAYLQGVRSFRWRVLTLPRPPGALVAGSATEVSVRFHVSTPFLHQLAGSLPRTDPGEEQELHVLMVSRPSGAQAW